MKGKKEKSQIADMIWLENRANAEAKGKTDSKKNRNIIRWFFEVAVTLAVAAIVAMLFFQSVSMQESSMEPTLKVGDEYFINKMIYRVSSPRRGDIIVFRTNGSAEAALHISRVIGLPGETVQIADGKILIDGEIFQESKDYTEISNAGLAAKGISLGSEEYFVLGDNRNNSLDSRFGDIGKVSSKYITGKLWFQISPVSEMGPV